MAKLGSAKTKKFSIGTAEVRVGPMSMANKLTQAYSVGLLDDVTINITQESVNLEGGFPKVLVDTAIINQTSSVSATLREFSRRNMQISMGEGVGGVEKIDVKTYLANDAVSGAVSLTVVNGDDIDVGDTLVVYPVGKPENLSVVVVDSKTGNDVSLSADTPLLMDYVAGTNAVEVFVSQSVPVGAVAETNYMSVSVVQRENSTGRPQGFTFWKASIASGLEYANNPDDYASMGLELNILQPSLEELAVGGALEHIAGLAEKNPSGMYLAGA